MNFLEAMILVTEKNKTIVRTSKLNVNLHKDEKVLNRQDIFADDWEVVE